MNDWRIEVNPDKEIIKGKNLHFYTNVAREDKETYVDAIIEYWHDHNTDDLFFISDYAYDIHGKRILDYVSLWVSFDNRKYTNYDYTMFRTILRNHIQKKPNQYSDIFITEKEFSL